ncbi:hypothetical protein GNI_037200 [Gregarina niphandrodes]|uniref:Uncharacterized protein n=1 Tax=Gregarina niphandrodes TaxID=110365 RepID=A0A023BAP3_GRENI|nr:hypothetical protein GNI_037200 [Gregarina niphandrodes]EZG78388.1 hypothetical protein GNI_037200 [Gregarina niphandrodes]|eukprot:XP_011129321.1 hypothetical protein GNI_037200 [Gregarina niphandrodes]
MTRGVESSTGNVGRMLCGGLLSSVIVDADAASVTLRGSQTGLALLLRAGAAKESYKLSEIHDGIINLRSGRPRYTHLATWLARQPEFEALSQTPEPSLPVTKPVGITNSNGAPLVEIVNVSSDGKRLYRLDFAAKVSETLEVTSKTVEITSETLQVVSETRVGKPGKVSCAEQVEEQRVATGQRFPNRVPVSALMVAEDPATVVIEWEEVDEHRAPVTTVEKWSARLDAARTRCALGWKEWTKKKTTNLKVTEKERIEWCAKFYRDLRTAEDALKMLALHIRQRAKRPLHQREEEPEEYEYDLKTLYSLVLRFRQLLYCVVPASEHNQLQKRDADGLKKLHKAVGSPHVQDML